MKDGYKVFDSDTHVGPRMEVLDKYLTDKERVKLPAWEQYKYLRTSGQAFARNGTTYMRGARNYRRHLGKAKIDDSESNRYMAQFSGGKKEQEPSERLDFDPNIRIGEMDLEGADVNLMLPSGWFGSFLLGDDVELEMGIFRTYHRWLNDYCSAYPERLGAVLLASGRDVAGTVEEIRRWGKSRWAWGIMPYPPPDMPLDHPDFEPIWAAAEEYDLAITLHTFTSMPPYSPGGLDNWDNMFLQRSAAHPWCGMRNMAALIGSGVMDRYPKLRIGTLEAGHGWLPFWLARIDEHAETCSSTIAKLKHKPSEYVLGGRYFQSIEIHEGAKLTNLVSEALNDEVLMFGSDYPHGENIFPNSVKSVMAWDLPKDRKRKLFWDNAVKFYARSGHK